MALHGRSPGQGRGNPPIYRTPHIDKNARLWPDRTREGECASRASPPRAELAAAVAVAVVPIAACAQAPSVMPRIGERGQKGFRSLTADARKRGSGAIAGLAVTCNDASPPLTVPIG
jgi:hypothetical protein